MILKFNLQPFALTKNYPAIIKWGALFIIFFIALFLRLDNIGHWIDNPERYFHNQTPNILNLDGYFYLDLARDLVDRTYHPVDQDKTIPYGQPRPSPAPLLSVITSKIHIITGIKLEWIALWLPSVLGSFIVIPLFLMGLRMGGLVMATSASLVGALSPHFLQRSTFGWFDTDSLVVVFPLAIAWAVYRFATTQCQRRWIFLAFAFLFEILFLWWWDFGPAPVLGAFLIPMSVAIVFFSRNKTEFFAVLTTTTLFAAFIAIFKPTTLNSLFSTFSYLNETEEPVFPSSGSNVVEQFDASLSLLTRETMGGWLGFSLAVIGFGVFIYKTRKSALFLTFPFLVGCLSFSAVRFLIFLAPIVALSIGALIQGIWDYKERSKYAIPLAICVFLISIGQMLLDYDRDNQTTPLRLPYQIQAFKQMDAELPKDAAIWTDWSHGYPILYHGKRGTFADGANHSGRMLFFLGFPLAVESPRIAANFIRFYAKRGRDGLNTINRHMKGDWSNTIRLIQRLFYAGPDGALTALEKSGVKTPENQQKWLEFLFPPESRPLYIMLDYDKVRTPWYKFGSWNFENRSGPDFVHEPFLNLRINNSTIENDNFRIDLSKGVAIFHNSQFILKQLIVPGKGIRQFRKNGYSFELHEQQGWGVLMSENVLNSVGRQLYGFKLNNNPWFTPVIDNLPLYGIWKVTADNLNSDK